MERFLRGQDKVKVTIMFRGREVTHPERGKMILDRLAEDSPELAIVEQRPNLDGRNMTMMLGPRAAAEEKPARRPRLRRGSAEAPSETPVEIRRNAGQPTAEAPAETPAETPREGRPPRALTDAA